MSFNIAQIEQLLITRGAFQPAGGNKFATFITDFNANMGEYRTRSIGGTGAHRWTITVPPDFNTLVSIVLRGTPSAGAAGPGKDIDLFSEYGFPSLTAFSESNTTQVLDLTGQNGNWVDFDISSVFSNLAAGHEGGIQIDHNGIGGAIEYTYIRMVYT